MPWNRNDPPDPLEERRRKLQEQERLLAEQVTKLTNQLNPNAEPDPKQVEPPVWRLEEDHHTPPLSGPTLAGKRQLARQRQRDLIIFLIAVCILLLVMVIGVWVAYVHNTAPVTGP
jgi:hypothetical protein